MAYSNENVCIAYTGDGVTTLFPIAFDFVDPETVKAELWDTTVDPAVKLLDLIQGTHFDVSGANVQLLGPMFADLPVGQKLLLFRDTTPTHGTEYNTYQFPYATMNDDLDRIYQIAQENRHTLERALLNERFDSCAGGGNGQVTLPMIAQAIQDLENLILDYVALETRVSTAESDIGDLTSDLGLLEARTEILEDFAADIEPRVEDLETLIGLAAIVTLLAPTTQVAENRQIIVVKSSGVTVDMPVAPSVGDTIQVKNRGNFLVTIDGNGSTIDGDATHILDSEESSVNLVYDGTEWIIL